MGADSSRQITSAAGAAHLLSTTQCPLFLWKRIIHVTTTVKIGNLKPDQNNLQVRYANIKQQPGESISEYKRRIVNILDSFSALKLAKPSDADVATKFLFGVDDQRYESLKIYLGNEAANDIQLRWTELRLKPQMDCAQISSKGHSAKPHACVPRHQGEEGEQTEDRHTSNTK